MNRFLGVLEENEIVTVNQGVVFRIKAKTESYQFIKRKIVHNLNVVYESGLVEFLDESLNHPKTIILFGSYRWGQDRSDSDIDIAIETTEDVSVTSVRPDGIDAYEKAIDRKIHILTFNRKSIDLNLFTNLANGIVLSGVLEVRL
ncbi:nucleotidyltransferase domain-containing protein [Candidatus Woesearchaeota archaeon]|nr:nucleotidyltransferase domain-containing protein [Candidatus Woesearchaeota archaeon]